MKETTQEQLLATKTIKKIASVLGSVGFILSTILITLMTFALSVGVISRYVFNRPIFWIDEFSRIVLIWTIFIGAALALRRDSPIKHIGIDFFVSFLPSKGRKITDKIAWGIVVFFCTLAVSVGVKFIIQTISYRTAALGVPKAVIFINLPIFGVIALLFLIELLFRK